MMKAARFGMTAALDTAPQTPTAMNCEAVVQKGWAAAASAAAAMPGAITCLRDAARSASLLKSGVVIAMLMTHVAKYPPT